MAASRQHAICIKRAYAAPDPDDGYRVLVDRLWPRGLSKATAKLDEWDKDIAPSPELRIWFDHVPARFAEFAKRYRAELARNRDGVAHLRARAAKEKLTLIYAAKDPACNHALVLQAFLQGKRRVRASRYAGTRS